MEPKLVALKLVLDHLGVSVSPETFDDRRIIQKSIYLAQAAGIGLGYHYGWYIRGPYSTSLTKDYFSMHTALASGDTEHQGKQVPDWVRDKLDKIRALSDPPPLETAGLDRGDWLELVASLLYLKKTSRLDFETAREVLQREKPRLAPYASVAETKLIEAKI